MSAAEQRVKKLARLPSNSICANCGTDKKFGFSTVCIKFFTFVCNECKSSHQAISHRCKSLTMSSWTDAEVAELELKGNDYARRTWLKNAPPVGTNGGPKEGDHVDVFKRFVVDVYERRKYYGEDTGAAPQHVATAVPITQAPPAAAPRRPIQAPPPLPTPAPAADLLDFASAPPPSSVAPSASDIFQVDFDAFAPAPVQSFQPTLANAPAVSGSAFGFMSAPPAPTPTPTPVQPPVVAPDPVSSSFAFISKPPPAVTPAPVVSINPDFADFSGLSISSSVPAATSQPQAPKKAVMCHSSANQKASLISSMDSLVAPSANGFGGFGAMQQGGFGIGGINHSMGGVTNGMNHTMSQQQRMMMMQQQQHMMQNQGMMGAGSSGFNMNGNMMGGGMNNNMMGANSNMGSMGVSMMTPQQMMMMMNQQHSDVANRNATPNAMSSLSMSGLDVNAWTTGKK